ncbi:sensor histidine kinase [Nonomuraea candida]|uniref:sensor histidine kinase n=1 Tax=Nonomuraea candida TaxID=359159 RepID=UPI0006934129|nr:histidine kinase [Nonomuraea candida]
MATEDTRRTGRLRRPLATLSRLSRLGDIPVVMMLAWAGWLAVPWSFSGLAQARAAAAAAAADAEALQVQPPALTQEPPGPPPAPATLPGLAQQPRDGRCETVAWGIPAARTAPLTTVLSCGDSTPAPSAALVASTGEETTGLASEAGASGVGASGVGASDVLARERARIAGEVHDAAGHGLAAIAMQAGLALVTLDDDPEQARASLRAIKETSTTALAHLRAALDRIDPPAGDLGGLIDGVRAAGLPVDVEPAELTVPAHLHGAVYGVVRESLTNVLRHAGPTRALVRAIGDGREFVIEIADRGAGRPGASARTSTAMGTAMDTVMDTAVDTAMGAGEGRGLAGMRARVTEAGGRFAAGPREGGGFRVVARFPQVPA